MPETGIDSVLLGPPARHEIELTFESAAGSKTVQLHARELSLKDEVWITRLVKERNFIEDAFDDNDPTAFLEMFIHQLEDESFDKLKEMTGTKDGPELVDLFMNSRPECVMPIIQFVMSIRARALPEIAQKKRTLRQKRNSRRFWAVILTIISFLLAGSWVLEYLAQNFLAN